MSTLLTALSAAATIVDADLFYVVTDVATTPDSKKTAISTLFTGRTHTGTLTLDNNTAAAAVIDIDAPANTTAHVILCEDADALTTAGFFRFITNSTSVGTRSLGFIHNNNSLATGATCLTLSQDAAQNALKINQTANGTALSIAASSLSTSAAVVSVTASSLTTGTMFSSSANSLTTGLMMSLFSDSPATDNRILARVWNSNVASVGCTVMSLIQDADQRALLIDQNGNGQAIHILSESSTNHVIDVDNPKNTTGTVFQCVDADAITTGAIINLQSNSVSTGTRNLGRIHNQNTLAVNATCLELRQDAARRALFIDHNGATGFGIDIDQASNDASDVYAMRIVSVNAGAGEPGGINMANIAGDAPKFKFPADAVSSPGTLTHQVAIDIGGTTFYLPAYTTGT